MKLKILLLILIVGIYFVFGLTSVAAIKVSIEEKNKIKMENKFIFLEIEPQKGGRISSFIFKPTGTQYVYDDGGLFLDHFSQQTWPGEFLNANYDFKIIQNGPEKGVVKLWRKSTGKWKGYDKKLADIIIEKEFILTENNPFLKVCIQLLNKGKESKSPAFWIQHCMDINGDKENDWYYRPSSIGVNRGTLKVKGTHQRIGKDFVRDPVAGWSGCIDSSLNEGAIFLMDYNYLETLYNCIPFHTVEWFYEQIFLPPEKKWRTEVFLIPTLNFSSYAYASRNYILSIEPIRNKDGLEINFILRSSVEPLQSITLSGEIEGILDNKKVDLERISFPKLNWQPLRKKVFLKTPPNDPLLFRVKLSSFTIDGKKKEETFEYYYGGTYGENINSWFKPLYIIKSPEKRKIYLKPELTVKKTATAETKILYFKGLYHEFYRLEEAFKNLGKVNVKDSTYSIDQVGLVRVSYFPSSYEEIMDYDVIVMADIDAKCLKDLGREMIKYFVNNGGGLLVLGGPYAYGKGSYVHSQIDSQIGEIIPFIAKDPFDMKPCKPPAIITPLGKSDITKNLHWEKKPVCLWIHQMEIKPGAQIILKANNYPFLATWNFGKGRVAACAGTVLGEPDNESVPFWKWEGWPNLMANVIKWLSNSMAGD